MRWPHGLGRAWHHRRVLLARLLAIRPSDETQLILIAVVVGVLAALGYALLRTSLEQVEAYFFGPLHSLLSIDLGGWRRVG
ncbi:MAG: hypothetical protein COS73_00030, partial [Nitrospirae bacterium CG06_land_8_20_14_3_00_70_43]